MAEAASPPPVSHNGCPVAPWTDTSKEFLVLQKFPHLRRRLEDGLHCLSRSERARLELVWIRPQWAHVRHCRQALSCSGYFV